MLGQRHGPHLVAVSDRHRSWEMRVSAADVPRLQAVLDRVDGRLGDAPAPRGLSPVFSRCLVAVLSLLALSISQLTVAVVVLLASLRPARPLIGGAAAAAFAAALLVVRDGRLAGGLAALVLGVAGAVLMALAIVNRHQEARSARLPVAALSVLAALLLGSILLAGLDPIRLHQSARATPALPVLLVSIASALAWTRQRGTRFAAAAMALLAVSTAVLSSQAFLDAFGRDPFLVDTPAITPETVDATSVDRFPLPEATARVLLSPTGRFVAAQMDLEGEDNRSVMFHVGRLGDPLTAIAADLVRFVDDDTVLVGEDDQEGTTLRQIRLNSTHDVLWRQRIPRLRGAALGLSRDGRWHLEGWQDEDTIVRAEGIVGVAKFVERRWTVAGARNAWINAMRPPARSRSSSRPVTTAASSGTCRPGSGCSACSCTAAPSDRAIGSPGTRRPRRWASRASVPSVPAARPMARFSAVCTTAHGPASSGSTLATARYRRSARSRGASSPKTLRLTDG